MLNCPSTNDWGVPVRRVAGQAHARRGHEHADGLDLAGVDVLALGDLEELVEGVVHVPTAGVGLEPRAQDLPLLAEARRGQVGVRVVGVPVEEPAGAVDGVARGEEVGLRQRQRQQRAVGGQPRVGALVPAAVLEELQRAGGLAPVEAHRVRDGPGVEPEDAPRGRGRAERAAGRGHVEAPVVVGLGVDGRPEPDSHLVAGDDARQQFRPGGVDALGRGERRRQHGRPRMQRRRAVRVVVVEAVGHRAVEQRGVLGRHRLARREDGPGGAAVERPDSLEEGVRGGRARFGAGGDAGGVEEEPLGVVDHLLREVPELEVGRERRLSLRDGHTPRTGTAT
jgi:hypothetical protein